MDVIDKTMTGSEIERETEALVRDICNGHHKPAPTPQLDFWDTASIVKVHIQEMDEAHWVGDDEAAEQHFEKAWEQMREAYRMLLQRKVRRVENGGPV